jgi:CBS-domain-containing membrane protein
LPPFAVICYLVFQNPREPVSRFRSIVILPLLAAIAGELCYRYLGFTPIGVAAAALLVLAVQSGLRADMPPAIALAVLAMLLHTGSPTYVLGVVEGALLIFMVFRFWRHFAH